MNNIAKIKQYNKLCKPNKWLWFAQLATYITNYLLGVYIAIPSANAITQITIGDLNGTIFWLIITFAVVFAQQFLNFVADRLYYLQLDHVWQVIHSQIYDKINKTSNAGFANTSKEKIINIAYNNVGTLADFPNDIAKFLSYLLQAVISIVILLSYNIIIGAAIVLICVILFFVQNWLNKKAEKHSDKYYLHQDKSLEHMSDLYNNNDLTDDLNLNDQMRSRYLESVNKSRQHSYKRTMVYSVTGNWVPLCYNFIIMALSIYMVILTKSNILTLTLYLVLTNYLTKSITQMVNSYQMFDYINSAHVATLRVKNILEMEEEDIFEFGENITDEINADIVFTNVSYNQKKDDIVTAINKFSIKIDENSSTLFYGSHNCGKRAIYHMLTRSIKPQTGTITINNINIYDFDKETFKHNLATATSNDYFYNDSIMNNLLLSGASKSQIYNTCKKLGIHDKIVGSQNSYNTNIIKEAGVFTTYDKYLLGIARALCTNAEIIVIYEIPSGFSDKQKDNLKKIFKEIQKEHTFILFACNEWATDICKNIYKVDKNTVTKKLK